MNVTFKSSRRHGCGIHVVTRGPPLNGMGLREQSGVLVPKGYVLDSSRTPALRITRAVCDAAFAGALDPEERR
jgi:hypothetical protein